MNARLFSLYTLIIVLIESLGVLIYTKLLPMAGYTPTMKPYQIGLTAALVAIAATPGLAAGYYDVNLADESPMVSCIFAVIVFCAIGYCVDSGYYNAIIMIIAVVVSGVLARIADYVLESIELNSYNIDLGRF